VEERLRYAIAGLAKLSEGPHHAREVLLAEVRDPSSQCARHAAEEGTCISIVTMEGEDSSMENLGVCADLTGGQVDMVDLQTLSAKVGAMLANPIVGTGLEVTIIVGGGAVLNTEPTALIKGGACNVTHKLGNATARTTMTFGLGISASADSQLIPVQLQLHYKKPTGEVVLQVLTALQPTTASRTEAETDINGACIALNGIHCAARLAQQGNYRGARVKLISTCRLLQRAMHSLQHQEAYLSFIVQAEKLDGFMRERESQDRVFSADKSAQHGRDDDASRSMYQMKTLSIDEFLSRA